MSIASIWLTIAGKFGLQVAGDTGVVDEKLDTISFLTGDLGGDTLNFLFAANVGHDSGYRR